MRYWKFTLEGAPRGGWSSHYNGQMDPGAPLVEFDITVGPQDQSGTAGFINVWGQPVSLIKASQSFYGKKYSLSVGMGPGLPFATAQSSQAGQILGTAATITSVMSSFEGLTQYVGFGLGGTPESKQTPPPFTASNQAPPRNIVLNWRQGTPLSQALKQTLQTAYPEMKSTVSVSPQLVAPQDNIGFYESMSSLNSAIRAASRAILGPNLSQYGGVSIVMANGKIDAHDQTQSSSSKQLQFTDLIGQPTFIQRNTIQVKTVMRGDLSIGNQITLPSNVILNVNGNLGEGVDLAVQGSWLINNLRWVGNSRSPQGDAWCTIIEANQAPGGGSSNGSGGQAASWSEGAVGGGGRPVSTLPNLT
jgi:hypothetical protein